MKSSNTVPHYRPGGKYIWHSAEGLFTLKRLGPDVYSHKMYYKLSASTTLLSPRNIDDLIQVLQEVKCDAEGRMM